MSSLQRLGTPRDLEQFCSLVENETLTPEQRALIEKIRTFGRSCIGRDPESFEKEFQAHVSDDEMRILEVFRKALYASEEMTEERLQNHHYFKVNDGFKSFFQDHSFYVKGRYPEPFWAKKPPYAGNASYQFVKAQISAFRTLLKAETAMIASAFRRCLGESVKISHLGHTISYSEWLQAIYYVFDEIYHHARVARGDYEDPLTPSS